MNIPNTVFGEAKSLLPVISSILVLQCYTHILHCAWVECNVNTLSGAQCQHWYLDRQHNAPSTIALSQCATSLSTSTKIQPRAFFLLHFFQFYQICSCPRANTWMTPSYQLRVLGEKWHFKLRVRRWRSRCKSYEWYQHHILCSIQTFFLVCWDYIIANYQKLQKLWMHLEGVLLLNITHSSSPHFGWQ